MERISLSAIKVQNIIIYRADLDSKELNSFIKRKDKELHCDKTRRGNIFLEGSDIVLQEWDKYKVKSLDDSFNEKDFIKVGEYGSENYCVLLFKNCVGIAYFKEVRLLIESSKISAKEMDDLIDVVNSYIINLSYDYNQSTFSEIERDKSKRTDLDYHVYLLIHND